MRNMALSNEQILFIVALVAALILPLWMRHKDKLMKKAEEVLDDVEDIIEDKTGLDIELSDAVGEVLEDVADSVSEALEDVAEDGVLDSGEQIISDLKDSAESAVDEISDEVSDAVKDEILEKLNSKKVSELKDLLKAHGLNVGGVKQELIDRLVEAGVDVE